MKKVESNTHVGHLHFLQYCNQELGLPGSTLASTIDILINCARLNWKKYWLLGYERMIICSLLHAVLHRMEWLDSDDWIDWKDLVVKHVCEETELLDEINCLKGNEQSRDVLSFIRCMYSAVKAEYAKDAILIRHREIFSRLYCDIVPKTIGFYLCEQSWEWMFHWQDPQIDESRRKVYSDEGVIVCLALLTELSVVMLHSLDENENLDDNDNPERLIADTIWVVRTLASALDRCTLFQRHHADRDLPSSIQYNSHTFTKFIERPKLYLEDGEIQVPICSKTPSMSGETVPDEIYYKPCECRICEPPESYRWITILLECFGNNGISDVNGFEELVTILNSVKQPETLKLEVVEVVLHFVSMAVEFLKDEIAGSFFDPCVRILRFISTGINSKYTAHSLGAVSMIFKHLRSIFKHFLQPMVAECMVDEGKKSMQEQLLATFSVTVESLKQLGSEKFSAVEARKPSSLARSSADTEPPLKLSSRGRKRSSSKRRQNEIV